MCSRGVYMWACRQLCMQLRRLVQWNRPHSCPLQSSPAAPMAVTSLATMLAAMPEPAVSPSLLLMSNRKPNNTPTEQRQCASFLQLCPRLCMPACCDVFRQQLARFSQLYCVAQLRPQSRRNAATSPAAWPHMLLVEKNTKSQTNDSVLDTRYP